MIAPGLGLSDPCPGRRVVDWPADVASLADSLGIGEFAVVGWSMGGPYAAACAAVLEDRVSRLALLAPAPLALAGPGGAETTGKSLAWKLARDDPWHMALLYTSLGLEARRSPERAVRMFTDGCSPSELQLFADAKVRDDFIAIIIEATRQGAVGLVADMRVEMAAWGFEPGTIAVPVRLWQGDNDSFVDEASARAWVERIPGAVFGWFEGEGHFLPFTRTAEVADFLLGGSRPR